MSQFKYTLPSGSQFVVNGPADATQAQADRIFYEQVAAGNLVDYLPGQTLTSSATKLTRFDLSRLQRGTAGIEDAVILSIVQNLPGTTGIPNLINVPLTNPIDQGDVVLVKGDSFSPDPVGPLSSAQVEKILAQIVNLVEQPYDVVTQDKGVGKYGFTCYQLEQAGYVKPGTSLRFFAVDPEDFVSVMNSPSIWTGNNGVTGLSDLLNSPETQSSIQNDLMQQGYDNLVAAGVITNVTQPAVSASTGQVYTGNGLLPLSPLASIGGTVSTLNSLIRNGGLSTSSLNNLLSTPLNNLTTIGSGAVNSLLSSTGLPGLNFSSLTTGITRQINGEIGSLITNSGKFGSAATTLWAKGGGLDGFSNLTTGSVTNLIQGGLTNFVPSGVTNLVQGGLTGITNNITGLSTGSLNTISTQLTNIVPGQLNTLNANLDVFGKAGSFATNFTNPLGSFGDLSGIGTQLSGTIKELQGSITALAGDLQGQITTLVGDLGLGSFADFAPGFGAVADVFGGGGDLVSGTKVAAGFSNTVNRSTVDAAFKRVVGNDKISLPTFEYPSLPSIASRLDITQARNFLKNIQLPSSTSTFGQTTIV